MGGSPAWSRLRCTLACSMARLHLGRVVIHAQRAVNFEILRNLLDELGNRPARERQRSFLGHGQRNKALQVGVDDSGCLQPSFARVLHDGIRAKYCLRCATGRDLLLNGN